ncbi:signal peptidase II [Planctomycetes bacterium SV_7m_r]
MTPKSERQDASSRTEPSLLKRGVLFLSLAVLGGGLDLYTKQAIFAWRGLPGEKDIWWVWEPYFGIETAVNIGALFGVGAGKGTLFAAISILAAIGVIVWLFVFRGARSLWLTWAMGLVGGGIIGNLYDRLGLWWDATMNPEWKSGVRDWVLWRINEQWTWPNFNIADSLLVVGAGMLLYQSLFPGQFESLVDEDPSSSETPAEDVAAENVAADASD